MNILCSKNLCVGVTGGRRTFWTEVTLHFLVASYEGQLGFDIASNVRVVTRANTNCQGRGGLQQYKVTSKETMVLQQPQHVQQ